MNSRERGLAVRRSLEGVAQFEKLEEVQSG